MLSGRSQLLLARQCCFQTLSQWSHSQQPVVKEAINILALTGLRRLLKYQRFGSQWGKFQVWKEFMDAPDKKIVLKDVQANRWTTLEGSTWLDLAVFTLGWNIWDQSGAAASFCGKKPPTLVGFQGHLTWRRPRSNPITCWRDLITHQTEYCLRIPRKCWNTLLVRGISGKLC